MLSYVCFTYSIQECLGHFFVMNLALGKQIRQDSTVWHSPCGYLRSLKAVDGDTNPDVDACACSMLWSKTPANWWLVDLLQAHRVDSIKVYNRLSIPGNFCCCFKLCDSNIFISFFNLNFCNLTQPQSCTREKVKVNLKC